MYKYMEQIQFCWIFCEFYSGIKKCRVSWAQEHFWKKKSSFHVWTIHVTDMTFATPDPED